MTPKKIQRIKNELFSGRQKNMAERLGISANKISVVIAGKQKLQLEAVEILFCDYKIDPYWFFKAEDDEPIVFKTDKLPTVERKYAEVLEKQIHLLEEKLEVYGAQNVSLKKSPDVHDS